MQFKQVKNRIQVLAYRGYDKEKRRAIVKMLGSLDVFTLEPSESLLYNLESDEKKELQSYIRDERQKRKAVDKLLVLKGAPATLKELTAHISKAEADSWTPTKKWGADVWEAIDQLSKALRKAGIKKPRKEVQQKLPL